MKLKILMMTLTYCSLQMQGKDTNALQVKEYKLDNGLTIWLNEDHSQPKVFGAVVVKAGAKDCPDTGIAHYFEHMMFKGTDRIGTLNYQEERKILDSIEAKYNELSITTDIIERKRIQKEINELNVKSADYIIPNEFNRLITRFGGSGLNAATSYDATIYFNTFSPQYMEQWAEINSERLIKPVFRLFQSELETVYEEKNMYGDFIGGQVMDTLLARYFGKHPYAYPIIGSTQNLKNPSLTQMKDFFDKYYIASNMALILSGDFNTEAVIPILEKTFSRIRKGDAPMPMKVPLNPFNGREKMKVKFPVPFVKGMAMGFRGISANHQDQVALNIAVSLLNNTNGTGYLDKLMVNHKIMGALTINESMNEAGILAIAIIPKLLLQSYGAAEKMVWDQINRIKEGDFSDDAFNSLKLEQKRQYASALENMDSRASVMMNLFSQGKTWNYYLQEVSRIDSISKEDVINAAKKYFSENYLCVTKSTGKYPKDNLPKPEYGTVLPKHADATSSYAKELESLPIGKTQPRFLDFENDVEITPISDLVKLYKSSNPLNDIFTLNIIFGIGFLKQPQLNVLSNYLQYLGTDSASFDVFRQHLQAVGSTLSFNTTSDQFVLKVTGFDEHFNETLKLVSDFMRHAKAEDKKLKSVIDEAKVAEKTFFKSNDNVASAMIEKIKFGDESKYLKKPSLAEIKKLKGKDLITLFKKVQHVSCEYHYCGMLPTEEVKKAIIKYMPLKDVKVQSDSPVLRPLMTYDKPTIFFMDMPDVSQSIIYTYTKSEALPELRDRYAAALFSIYFGGDMSSLMFQEIREFRSLAYRTNGRFILPSYKYKDTPGCLVTMLSTQCDKTLDALEILHGLIAHMPFKPERMSAVKQILTNQINNDYPAYRNISEKIALLQKEGYSSDPSESCLRLIENMDMEDIKDFYMANIKNHPITYVIIGNQKKIDLKKLSVMGKIVKVKKKDIYK